MPYEGRERKSFGGGGRSGGFGGRRSFGGPREMHKVKCTACGKDAEVPFKPREGAPVYCKECYLKNKGSSGSGPRESFAPKKSFEKTEKKEKPKEDEFESEESEDLEEDSEDSEE
ncbi:Uncharacterised protein [Candidatus Tiddalikarchaeum anstoanum]|nr:Uncharacterised protein [Candidatus Tiddalikarchaeum anstoanum]